MAYEWDTTMNNFSVVLKASQSHLSQIQPLTEYKGKKLFRWCEGLPGKDISSRGWGINHWRLWEMIKHNMEAESGGELNETGVPYGQKLNVFFNLDVFIKKCFH